MKSLVLALLAGALAIVAGGQTACAAEIKLLTAGAMRAVVVALLPDFEKETGHKVTIDNATAGTLKKSYRRRGSVRRRYHHPGSGR